jgi:hypothetical protein
MPEQLWQSTSSGVKLPSTTQGHFGAIALDASASLLYVSAWGCSGGDCIISIDITSKKAAQIATGYITQPTGISVDLGTGSPGTSGTGSPADLIVSSFSSSTTKTVVSRVVMTSYNRMKSINQMLTYPRRFLGIRYDYGSGNLVGVENYVSR